MKAKEDESRDQKILELYLACYTYEEISKDVGYADKSGVVEPINKLKNGILAESQLPPTSLQYTNLWEFNACDPEYGEKGYPGRMPGQIIENLLWYYTQPFDVVLDPMAGGGTTMDASKSNY